MEFNEFSRVWNLYLILSQNILLYCRHHETVKIEIPYKIHTIHHHHTEKFPVYKKVEVPVVKEIKGKKIISLNFCSYINWILLAVPYPVHVPSKNLQTKFN